MATYRIAIPALNGVLTTDSTTACVLYYPTVAAVVNSAVLNRRTQAQQQLQAQSVGLTPGQLASINASISTASWIGKASRAGTTGSFSFPFAEAQLNLSPATTILTVADLTSAVAGVLVLIDAGSLENPATSNSWRLGTVLAAAGASAFDPYARACQPADNAEGTPSAQAVYRLVTIVNDAPPPATSPLYAEDGSVWFTPQTDLQTFAFRGHLSTVGALGTGPALVETESQSDLFVWVNF